MKSGKLKISHLSKIFAKKMVIKDFNMDVDQGDFVTILGPSGAGKSTVLKMIAGFEQPSSGTITLNGSDLVPLQPYKRNIGMLFQNYALFPHMTVAQNVAFPLSIRKVPKKEQNERVKKILEMVKLSGFEDRKPSELSGGQQQRVALSRALVFNPPLLLLDEPMAALDKQLRKHMQIEIRELHEKLGITTISVTHDQEEALTMANKVCVMRNGHVIQMADPKSIYSRPNCKFVANFIGEANVIPGVVRKVAGSHLTLAIYGKYIIDVVETNHHFHAGEDVDVVIRPEKVDIVPESDNEMSIAGIVEQSVYLGESIRLKVKIDDVHTILVKVFSRGEQSIQVDDRLRVRIQGDGIVVLKKEKNSRGDLLEIGK